MYICNNTHHYYIAPLVFIASSGPPLVQLKKLRDPFIYSGMKLFKPFGTISNKNNYEEITIYIREFGRREIYLYL